MRITELLIISAGLSMDACAVAVCKGLSMCKMSHRDGVIIGLYFGVFQALMPVLGYLFGIGLSDYITAFDHWLAFALLSLIGVNMIREGATGKCESCEVSIGPRAMLPLAFATSVDALAVGISFAFLKVEIWRSASIIGIITFLLSYIGVVIGNKFGVRFKSKAEITGGIILIGMGVKILIEHLFFL